MEPVRLTIHRSAHEIGGNCIEIAQGDSRLLLDLGLPLTASGGESTPASLPPTLDLTKKVAGVVLSHPHRDHFGLLSAAPEDWPLWCGKPTAKLLHLAERFEAEPTTHAQIPSVGWPHLKVVITNKMRWFYESRLGEGGFIERCCVPHGIGAAKLREQPSKWVIMTRPSLMDDFVRKGIVPTNDDVWSFSIWSGYLKEPDYERLSSWFVEGGVKTEHIHTSGHASPDVLKAFAVALAPKYLVPIHSFDWDAHIAQFDNVLRLPDGCTIDV